MFYQVMKRVFDFTLALIGAVVTIPFFLVIMLAIKIESKGPIFFIQKRVGKNKKHFRIYKFRTMKIETPQETATHLLEDPEQWITRVGSFLRVTSLDELPQLYNILFGKMSIVGPRPALWNQYDLIEERDKYGANDLRPGITGWAQVNGRDTLTISDKAKLDGMYVKKASFITDIKLVIQTFFIVLKRDGNIEGGTGSKSK